MSYGIFPYGVVPYGDISGEEILLPPERIAASDLVTVNWTSNPTTSESFTLDETIFPARNEFQTLLDSLTNDDSVLDAIVLSIIEHILTSSVLASQLNANNTLTDNPYVLDLFGTLDIVIENVEIPETVIGNFLHIAFILNRISTDDILRVTFEDQLLDIFLTADSVDLNIIGIIIDKLSSSDILVSQADQKVFVVENGITSDKLYISIPTTVLENAELTDLSAVTKEQLVALINTLTTADLLGSVGVFGISFDEVIDLSDVIGTGAFEAILASITSSDSFDVRLLMSIALNGSMGLTESPTAYVKGFLEALEDFLLDDSNSTRSDTSISVSEDINISHFFDPINMRTWVMNPENYAVYNYTFGFRETCRFDNNHLMADDTGLYVLGGTNDNGNDIISVITTSALDFGSDSIKQVPSVLLGTNGTDFILKVSIDGNRTARYQINCLPDNLETKRIKLGKGLIGRRWQFTLITDNNSEFDLDSFEFYPIVFKRKHNG